MIHDERLIDTLRSARSVVVVTGAGISAESGIATFRNDEDGLWNRFNLEDYASLDGFLRQPEMVWSWYAERRQLMLQAQPNPAHLALSQMEQYVQTTIITQNIDGLHQRAGSRHVIELHGSIHGVKCPDPDHGIRPWPADDSLARCEICDMFLRPNVVWFGEQLNGALIRQAEQACWDCDVLIAIGTSGLVAPAATFPMTARAHGARLIDINPLDTPLSKHARHVVRAPAGSILPGLVAAAWQP